jgi:hypothetical protein
VEPVLRVRLKFLVWMMSSSDLSWEGGPLIYQGNVGSSDLSGKVGVPLIYLI